MPKIGIYTRYSSDAQNEKSTADQEYECREYAEKLNGFVLQVFTDNAISGTITDRPAYIALLQAIENRNFDILLVESLDRLSRNLGDLAKLYELLEYYGIKLITLQEGDNIDDMHIAFKGLESARYIKNLSHKTKRGQRGRMRIGKNPGSCPYGYETSKEIDPVNGGKVRGELIKVESECSIIVDIFTSYIEGTSPEKIAKTLNDKGIPSPSGKSIWRGNSVRKILRNKTYAGVRTYGMKSTLRKPGSKKVKRRDNPESEWLTYEDENLRIIGDNVWKAAQDRLTEIKQRAENIHISNKLTGMRRVKYALSGKLVCGSCGGKYTMCGRDRYSCSNHRAGECSNARSIMRHLVEGAVLDILLEKMFEGDRIKSFLKTCREHIDDIEKRESLEEAAARQEIARIDKKLTNYTEAIGNGIDISSIRDQILELQKQRQECELSLPSKRPISVPDEKIISEYRNLLQDLAKNLDDDLIRQRAMNILRPLVDKIVLHHSDKGLHAELHGTLGNLLHMRPDKGDGFLFAPESNIALSPSIDCPIFDSMLIGFFLPDLRFVPKNKK